jgi:site-specific recombinase XerD
MGQVEVGAFLTHLAVDGRVAASTQNQALNALVFLYREVLGRDLGTVEELVRAKRPPKLPVVLSVSEVTRVLNRLDGVTGLMVRLLASMPYY